MNEESIFAAVLELKSQQERQAYLDHVCAGDDNLREQVEGLLRAESDAGSFLNHPPLGMDATIEATAGSRDTVDSGTWPISMPFLEPCDKPDRIGKMDQYEIIEVVGQGGMGAVLRAFDTKLSRIVAVKVMAPHLAASPTAVKRFLREATTAAAVHHDHVVTIHAVDDTHHPPYLVMQYIEGQTLQQKIDREGALDLKQILRIGSQMAAGLAAAHKHGLIHRDVKPANILLENGVERVKITDFGLARAADDLEVTQTGMIAGTPQYMSPEQAKGEPIDTRSDLFSLGSVLYSMCAGRPAFRADNTMAVMRRVCDDAPRPIQEVNAEIPRWLEAIVKKLLAKNPTQRFQTAIEVAELLGQHLAHEQNPAQVSRPATVVQVPDARPLPPVTEAKPANGPPVRRQRKIALGIATLICALIAVVLSLAAFLIRQGTRHATISPPIATMDVPPNWSSTFAELATRTASTDGWIPLFNGKDLTGWKAIPPQNWHAENGAIHGAGPDGFLFTEVGDFDDFHLVAEYRINEMGDSGIHFRSPAPQPHPAARWGYIVTGMEAQVSVRKAPAYRSGALTVNDPNFRLLAASSVPPHAANEWVGLEIIALKDHIQILINGKLVTDFIDPDRKLQRGHIALCSWEGSNIKTNVEFRKVEVRKLPVAAKPKSVDLATWGKFEDPRGDCRLERHADRAAITVPGGLPHNLLPVAGYNLDAPRLMQEIDGDFVVQVTVLPYPRSAAGTSARGKDRPSYRSAGLVVWVDGQNLLRFERSSWGERADGAPFLHVEWHVAGQYRGDESEMLPDQPDGPTHLQLARRGSELHLSWSRDGQSWQPWRKVFDMNLQPQVSIGVHVQNSTDSEFKSVFEGMAVDGLTSMLEAAPKVAFPVNSSADILTSDQWEWTKPENLGAVINSPASDGGPVLSGDGLELIFHSNRYGGQGNGDLWGSTRRSLSEPWAAPKSLGENVNSSSHDANPCLSADGRTLIFESHRREGYGAADLWMTTRPKTTEPWSQAVNLGEAVNSDWSEAGAALSSDGLTLLFNSNRQGGMGTDDLWECSRESVDGNWSTARFLGQPVTSPASQGWSTLASDGLTLIFNSNRNGGTPYGPLWLSTRASSTNAWSNPVLLWSDALGSWSPSLSADNTIMVFDSRRAGGQGEFDIWMTRRVRK